LTRQSILLDLVIPGCALLGADPESSSVHRSGFRVRSLCSRPGMTVSGVAEPGSLLPAVAFRITLVTLSFADNRLRFRIIAVSTMISEVYDAFIAAGAPEDKARKAAETLANTDNRFSRIDGEVLKVQSEILLLKWMVGFAIALNVAILTRSFFH
jgi:hypothetical protein